MFQNVMDDEWIDDRANASKKKMLRLLMKLKHISNIATSAPRAPLEMSQSAKVIESKEMAFNFSEYMELRNVYS